MAVLYVFPVANTEYVQFNDQNNDFITSIHYSELSFGMDSNGNVQFSHRRESAQLFPIQAAPFAEVLNEAGTPYSAVSLDAFIAAFTAALPLSGAAAGGGGGSAPDIATYDMQYDQNAGAFVRVLTTFDPITNVPTRTFFELDGVTPYVPADPDVVINIDTALKDIAQDTNSLLNYATKGHSTCKVNMRTIVGADTVVTQSNTVELQVIAIAGTFDIIDSDVLANITTFPITAVGGGIIPQFSVSAGEYRTLEPINIKVPAHSTVLIIEKS